MVTISNQYGNVATRVNGLPVILVYYVDGALTPAQVKKIEGRKTRTELRGKEKGRILIV
jgi:hypothetical protein